VEHIFLAAEEAGFPINKDGKSTSHFMPTLLTDWEVNNGDPIGMGLGAGCSKYHSLITKNDN
jgi:hypothetical protein